MNGRAGTSSVRQVLGEGWDVFRSGFTTAFPWVLAAELTALLPFSNPPGGIFTMDLSLLGDAGFWIRALAFGGLQAFLYGIAVQRIAAHAGADGALRAVPSVFVGYVCYEVMVAFGLVLTFAMFMLGMFILGPLAGLVLCILPLAPTAAASTAMALFIFPAVLDKQGPIAALKESSRLAKSSWVKVSLVISVPAIALLVASLVADAPGLKQVISGALSQLDSMQDGASDQTASLFSGIKSGGTVDRYSPWQIAGVLLGAVAWWYTLAVCYAQYRDLKAGEKP
jgi:hypothetical protein